MRARSVVLAVVAVGYPAVAWTVLQLVYAASGGFALPAWAFVLVLGLVVIGFPAGLFVVWRMSAGSARLAVVAVAAVVAYPAVTWLVLQLADVGLNRFTLPAWALTLGVLVVIIGLPIAVFLAWRWTASRRLS